MIFHEALGVEISKQLEVLDLTERLNRILKTIHIDNGILNLWMVHTTAALTVNENDKGLWSDLLK